MCWSAAIFWAWGVRVLSAVYPFLQNKVIGLTVSKYLIKVKAHNECHHKAYLATVHVSISCSLWLKFSVISEAHVIELLSIKKFQDCQVRALKKGMTRNKWLWNIPLTMMMALIFLELQGTVEFHIIVLLTQSNILVWKYSQIQFQQTNFSKFL